MIIYKHKQLRLKGSLMPRDRKAKNKPAKVQEKKLVAATKKTKK
jgi:hypothetical protein